MAPFNAKPEEMAVMIQVAARLRQLGMYTFVRWNYVFIAPPLCITREQIDEGLAMISDALTIADAPIAAGSSANACSTASQSACPTRIWHS